jgi:hypothetical protein
MAIVRKWLKYYNMAAVTGTIVALGGLGLSAAQAIKANKDMKQAAQAADKAQAELKNIKEFNAFKQVQVPTLGFELAQQGQAQATTQAMQSLQGAGAEGVIGGVPGLVAATTQADLDRAAKQSEIQSQVDLQRAAGEQAIEARRQEREFMIGTNQLISEQTRRADAENRRNKAIQGMFGSAGTALTSAAGLVPLYGQSGSASTGGINWNSMSNQQLPAGVNPVIQGQQYITGNTINQSTADALTGNLPGQVIFK